PALCVTCPGEAPGATGCVKGGSQLEFPVYVKKLAHCDAVTRFKVSTVGFGVGGVVVVGSQAAIWSASELGKSASFANVIRVPFGTSPWTASWIVTVVALLLSTAVPGVILTPYADIPATTPPVLAKVKMVPAGQSALVARTTFEIGALNVRTSVVATPPVVAALKVTVVVVTLEITVVPGALFVPLTFIPATIPSVTGVPSNVRVVVPVGAFAFGDAVRGEPAELNVITVVLATPLPVTGALSVTAVAVSIFVTTVSEAMFVPVTGIFGAIPSPTPWNCSVVEPPSAAVLGLSVSRAMM